MDGKRLLRLGGFSILLICLQNLEPCLSSRSVSLTQLDYLSKSLTPTECYQLYSLLDNHRQIRVESGITKQHDIPCTRLLQEWLMSPDISYKDIALKLKHIGKPDLAYWLQHDAVNHNGPSYSKALKREQVLDNERNHKRIQLHNTPHSLERKKSEIYILNSEQSRRSGCWEFVCIVIVIFMLVTLFLCCYRYFYATILQRHREDDDEECCLHPHTFRSHECEDYCPIKPGSRMWPINCGPKLSSLFIAQRKSYSSEQSSKSGEILPNEKSQEKEKLLTSMKNSGTHDVRKRNDNSQTSIASKTSNKDLISLDRSFLSLISSKLKSSMSSIKKPIFKMNTAEQLSIINATDGEEEMINRCLIKPEEPGISFSDTDLRFLVKLSPTVNTWNTLPKAEQENQSSNGKLHAASDSERNHATSDSFTMLQTTSFERISSKTTISMTNAKSISVNTENVSVGHNEQNAKMILHTSENSSKDLVVNKQLSTPRKLDEIRRIKSDEHCNARMNIKIVEISKHSLPVNMENTAFNLSREISHASSEALINENHSRRKSISEIFDSMIERSKSFRPSPAHYLEPLKQNEKYKSDEDLSTQNKFILDQDNTNKYDGESWQDSDLSETYDELGMLLSQYLKEQGRPCRRTYCPVTRHLRRWTWHDQTQCRVRNKYYYRYSYDQRPSCTTGNVCKDTYNELKLMQASPLERTYLHKYIYARKKQFLCEPWLLPRNESISYINK